MQLEQQDIMLDKDVLGLMYLIILCASESADANLALKKPTKLSSIFDPKISQGFNYICCNSTFAVDGDRRGTVINYNFYCAHTDIVANEKPWWAVDLQNIYTITSVEIFGRTDGLPADLANFDVDIIVPTCTCNHWNNLEEGVEINCHFQQTASQRITVTCPPNTAGRYVKIKRRDEYRLVICEVEVYGNPKSKKVDKSAGSVTTYACGKIGYGYVGPDLGPSFAQSNIECIITCITKTGCSAAEYDKKTQVCTLKGECLNAKPASLYPDIDKNVFFIQ